MGPFRPLAFSDLCVDEPKIAVNHVKEENISRPRDSYRDSLAGSQLTGWAEIPAESWGQGCKLSWQSTCLAGPWWPPSTAGCDPTLSGLQNECKVKKNERSQGWPW